MTKKLEQALERFDAMNAEDPNTETVDGEEQPKELTYGRRMSERLAAFAPDAPEEVKLAVRAQHLRRWTLPRSDFPMDRAGYLTWRTRCAKMHAELAGEVLEDVGYDEETIGTVQRVLTKRGLKTDPNVQLLEDVACLVFLEHYAAEFAGKHPKEKVIDIVQKTWKKMSAAGHEAAMALPLDPDVKTVVEEALA
jgi:hypothetical protein